MSCFNLRGKKLWNCQMGRLTFSFLGALIPCSFPYPSGSVITNRWLQGAVSIGSALLNICEISVKSLLDVLLALVQSITVRFKVKHCHLHFQLKVPAWSETYEDAVSAKNTCHSPFIMGVIVCHQLREQVLFPLPCSLFREPGVKHLGSGNRNVLFSSSLLSASATRVLCIKWRVGPSLGLFF